LGAVAQGLILDTPPLSAASPAAVPGADASLDAWLDYQQRVHPSAIELGLDRVRVVAARLGLPAAGIVTLTIAGTNGKGSSATLAALIYQQAGYRTGLYRSPHLLRYNERVVIDGVEASDAALCRAFHAIEQARSEIALTYFEFGTLAALWLFREAGVRVQVLEVGLGGRLDAVNIVDADCAMVTNIGLDHEDWLGAGREAIGFEKGGVFRANKPAVLVDPAPPQSLLKQVQTHRAVSHRLDVDYRYELSDQTWRWSSSRTSFDALPLPGLRGAVQLRNAAGVLAAIEALQPLLSVDERAIRAALPLLKLAGRFENRGRWWFDVAHNTEAAEVLAENIAALLPNRAPWLLLGMLSDKPIENVARVLAPYVAGATFVSLPPPRGLEAATLQQRAASVGLHGAAIADMASAMREAASHGDADAPVLVCGSFLTVAMAIEWLDQSLDQSSDKGVVA
jgi:dihydrofolate synthase/folylpolyglutamate synthase